jgi:hypothetical protein
LPRMPIQYLTREAGDVVTTVAVVDNQMP